MKSFAVFVLLIAGLLPGLVVRAQAPQMTWSQPFRISSVDLTMTDHTVYTDPYGYVHLFWTETLPDTRPIIKYSRFDGEIWTVPISIHIGIEAHTIKAITPVITPDNVLHLYWTQGIVIKRVVGSKVVLQDSLSAQNWAPAQPVNNTLVAENMRVQLDSQNTLHMVITRFDGESKGVYYLKSTDFGTTWSSLVWLDPDIPTGYVPGDLAFDIDDADGLHAVWDYAVLDLSIEYANWVRYGHFLPGDAKWSTFTIDRANVETQEEYQLDAAKPVMIVSGQKVLVIWAGGKLHFRHFRYSDDAGRTWMSSTRFMGNLNGQAGDGLAVDGNGRIHYFTQIRFPVGIYHATFSDSRWTSPTMVYFVRYAGETTGNVEAHRTYATIREGNQVILTFTDPPPDLNRGLYVMTGTLPDVEAVEQPIQPTALPSPTASPLPPPTITPAVEAVPQATAIVPEQTQPAATSPARTEGPEQFLVTGVLFSALVLIGIAGVRIIIKR